MDDSLRLKELYRKLDFERPLDISDPKDKALYVANLHSTDGLDPIDEMRVYIENSDQPNSWLFTGHRGVGKSTELRRLAVELRASGYVVIVSDVGDYLNLGEPISTESLLLTLVATLADWADKTLGGERSKQTYLQRFWQFLKTDIELTELTVQSPAGIISAKAALSQTPDLMNQVRRAVAGATKRLWEKVAHFAGEIVADVRVRDGQEKQVVLILDSLERLRVTGADAQKCYDAISHTFDLNGQFLKLNHLHVVYSVPPYLPYLIPRVGSYFGYGLFTLPQVKVFETPTDFAHIQTAVPCAAGQALMVASIQRRYPEVAELIPLRMLNALALASSGSVRDFFRLIRSACTKAQVTRTLLPLADDKLIVLAQQVLRNEMPLAEEDKVWLGKVRATHGTGLDKIDNLHQLARLFDCGVILSYRNGVDWCDVHYLLHDQISS